MSSESRDALLVKADRVASHLRSAASYVRGEQLPGWFDARFLKEASWVIVDLLALVAAARRGVADTRDAERYRFLRDNPLQLRAIDGNSAWCGQWSAKQFDEHTDASRAL